MPDNIPDNANKWWWTAGMSLALSVLAVAADLILNHFAAAMPFFLNPLLIGVAGASFLLAVISMFFYRSRVAAAEIDMSIATVFDPRTVVTISDKEWIRMVEMTLAGMSDKDKGTIGYSIVDGYVVQPRCVGKVGDQLDIDWRRINLSGNSVCEDARVSEIKTTALWPLMEAAYGVQGVLEVALSPLDKERAVKADLGFYSYVGRGTKLEHCDLEQGRLVFNSVSWGLTVMKANKCLVFNCFVQHKVEFITKEDGEGEKYGEIRIMGPPVICGPDAQAYRDFLFGVGGLPPLNELDMAGEFGAWQPKAKALFPAMTTHFFGGYLAKYAKYAKVSLLVGLLAGGAFVALKYFAVAPFLLNPLLGTAIGFGALMLVFGVMYGKYSRLCTEEVIARKAAVASAEAVLAVPPVSDQSPAAAASVSQDGRVVDPLSGEQSGPNAFAR